MTTARHPLRFVLLSAAILSAMGCSRPRGSTTAGGPPATLSAEEHARISGSYLAERRKRVEEARGRLTEALASSNDDTRYNAVGTILALDPKLELSEPLMRQAISDREVRVRVRAAGALVRIRNDQEALQVLIDMTLPWREPRARTAAIVALGGLGENAIPALTALRSLVNDAGVDVQVRNAVARIELAEARLKNRLESEARARRTTPSLPTLEAPPSRVGPGSSFWLGLLPLGYGIFTLYLRFNDPGKLGKLAAMKEHWGEPLGTALHWLGYTVVPLALGLVLVKRGLLG